MANKEKKEGDPATATIRVRAVRPGYYNHTFYKAGKEFLLRPILLADGTVWPAEAQLSLDRKNRRGEFVRGWMKRLAPGAPAAAARPKLPPQTEALSRPTTDDGRPVAAEIEEDADDLGAL